MLLIQSAVAAQRRGLWRLLLKGAILLAPLILWEGLEIFVLPPDAFTFRIWESMLSPPYRYPGPFYPNQHLVKEREYGDRYRINPEGREFKRAEWFTDAYGWRNRPELATDAPLAIVVTGDSNIVGSFFDQKDILTEVLGHRGDLRAYAYAYGDDYIPLFFNDPRFQRQPPKLLVVESKAGYWFTNNSSLGGFVNSGNGTLRVRDLSSEFADYYDPSRNFAREMFRSRLGKQPFYHYLQSELRLFYNPPTADWAAVGHAPGVSIDSTTKPNQAFEIENWSINGEYHARQQNPGFALQYRNGGLNCWWKSGPFLHQPGQPLHLIFEARSESGLAQETVWLFENESYRPVSHPLLARQWLEYDIPLNASENTPLRVQIDNNHPGQWLEIRNVRITGGMPQPLPPPTKTIFQPHKWSTTGIVAALGDNDWSLTRGQPNTFMKSSLFQAPEDGLIEVRFEARADLGPSELAYANFYLFENDDFRIAATPVYSSAWKEYIFLLHADPRAALSLQFDLSAHIPALFLRNVRVMTVKAPIATAANPTPSSSSADATISSLLIGPPERPEHLTPLDASGATLSQEESNYYFYHAVKTMHDEAARRSMDFIFFLMPDASSPGLMDAVHRLRAAGIKVIAYEPTGQYATGVDNEWYWQKADSHWREAAARLTADEILRLWHGPFVENRPFTSELEKAYSTSSPPTPLLP